MKRKCAICKKDIDIFTTKISWFAFKGKAAPQMVCDDAKCLIEAEKNSDA